MIRTAKSSDIPFLTEIYNDAVVNSTATFDTETKSIEDRTIWFDLHKEPHILLVYETNDGIIAGYASLSSYRPKPAYDTTAELSVYVKENYRRQHIGLELAKAVIEYAKSCEKIKNIVSIITADNTPSIAMHKALGFNLCGTIKSAGIKFGKLLDVAIYQLLV